jgi:hypothetical protein
MRYLINIFIICLMNFNPVVTMFNIDMRNRKIGEQTTHDIENQLIIIWIRSLSIIVNISNMIAVKLRIGLVLRRSKSLSKAN